MKFVVKTLVVGTVMASLAGCAKDGELDLSSGVGISVTRTGCPTVAVPDGTGDITLFSAAGNQDASGIDVVATITNVRPTCNSSGEKIYSQASFDVQARRSDPRGDRTVTVPYFSTIVQGCNGASGKLCRWKCSPLTCRDRPENHEKA